MVTKSNELMKKNKAEQFQYSTYIPISETNDIIGDNVPLVRMMDLTPCDFKSSIV